MKNKDIIKALRKVKNVHWIGENIQDNIEKCLISIK